MMAKNVLLWFPLSAAVLMPATFLVTYAWSVGLGHVEPDFPYISATGTYPPESCFFGLILNIIAILLLVTVWVRHRQIEDHCSQTVVAYNLPRTSEVASVFGYAAAFGICLVGNFQATNVASVHLIGAGMAFGLGNIYLWIQSWMSVHLMPRVNSKAVTVVRFVSSAIATLMIILTILFSFLYDAKNRDVAYWTEETEWWMDDERQHWEFHIIATASEWVLAAAFVVVLLSLVPEFKRMTFQGVMVEYDRDRDQLRERSHPPTQSSETINTIESERL